MTTVSDGLYQFGGVPVGTSGLPFPPTGASFFVDPVNGSDGNSGKKPSQAFKTIYKAYAACTAGNNDVVYLIGNGAASGTARLSLANAQTIVPAATSGMLTWGKNATHLIGICPPGTNARARFSQPTGTYTAATFGANTSLTVSASGCYMSNVSFVQSFSTGNAAEITAIVSGSYNTFDGVSFGFGLSAEAIAGTTARALKVTTGGENAFNNCLIGADTVTRSTTNATIDLAGGTARDQFNRCLIVMRSSSAGAFHILGTGASCISAWVLFDGCLFSGALDQGGSNLTAAGSFTSASPNGSIILRNCGVMTATKWGDANFLANSYVDNIGGAATAGLMLNPS